MCAGSSARHRLQQTCPAKAFQARAETRKLPAVRLGDGRIALHGDYPELEIASNMVSMTGSGTAPRARQQMEIHAVEAGRSAAASSTRRVWP